MTIERDVAAIRSVIYRMGERYGAMDAEGVLEGYISDRPTMIGTGPDEVRFGRSEVLVQVVRDMSESDALSLSMENIRVDVFDDAAFAFAETRIHATFDKSTYEFPLRATYGLIRTPDGWRIAQSHLSAAHGGQKEGRSFSVNLTKTLSDLLTSIDNSVGSSILRSKDMGTATILFTDIVDSTVLSQAMGDESWSELISDHFQTVTAVVTDEGGAVVKTLGDGGMYAFRSGTAAMLAAIRIQRAVAGSDTATLSVRAGAHTGDVVQGGNDYIGLTVNKAARVAAAADGGQILVSATTADVVNNSDIRLGDRMTVELKGLTGSHDVLPLLWDT